MLLKSTAKRKSRHRNHVKSLYRAFMISAFSLSHNVTIPNPFTQSLSSGSPWLTQQSHPTHTHPLHISPAVSVLW